MLTLKSKDPCIKSQLHLVFLGRSLRKWHPSESVPVRAAETRWQTDWPWRPQPEPAELKCTKAPPAPPAWAMGTVLFVLLWPPLLPSRKKDAFNSSSLSALWIQLSRDWPSLHQVKGLAFFVRMALIKQRPKMSVPLASKFSQKETKERKIPLPSFSRTPRGPSLSLPLIKIFMHIQ